MRNILKNKKGTYPSQWIGIAVFIGMLVAASSIWINSWGEVYTPIESPENISSYNAISEVAVTQDLMESKLQPEETPTAIGWLDFIVTGGYQVLITVLSVPNIIITLISDAAGRLGVPQVFVNGLIILISCAAIFGVIAAIFRRKT